MEFDLSKLQKLLQESARTLFKRQCKSERVRELMDTPTAHDEALWTEFADQGWTGLIFPESVEGLDLGLVELAALMEEMGRACVPGPFLSNTCAGVLLNELSSHDIANSLLTELSEGKSQIAVALHEESPDWNPDSAQISLGRGAGTIVLDGEKTLVSGAVGSKVLLCVVRDEYELVVVAIPSDRDGVHIKSTPSIDKTQPMGRVRLNSVIVKEDDILGRGAPVQAALVRMAQVGAVMASADMVGGMQWMLDVAVEYAKTREQFDRPIGAYQMVQEQCADMLLLIESSRSATYYAAWALNEGDPDALRAVSMAKAYCSDAAREVGNRSIQVHGGIGFTWEHDLHLYYKRAKASELLFGDATFHREELAKSLLDS
jgi:alkylation response protein AidB-like acyl-CoA dehydrogenase